MYAYDFDGDGDNDILTTLAAHGYGLAWYEQVKTDTDEITFNEHIIMNREPDENRYGLKITQMHAIDLADFDGDGIKDILTGKRFWAHGAHGDGTSFIEPSARSMNCRASAYEPARKQKSDMLLSISGEISPTLRSYQSKYRSFIERAA